MRKVVLFLLMICSLGGAAQVLRPVEEAWTLGTGLSSTTDTYLSPVTYRGMVVTIDYTRLQAMRFDPQRWVIQWQFVVDGEQGTNRVGNGEMWGANLSASWGMMRKTAVAQGLTAAYGGSTGVTIGVDYTRRNPNNPAAAHAAWTVNLTGIIAWDTHIGRLPITLRYQPTVPLIGAFFAPDYDELYYEIYLGNHHGLAHMAWPGNRFAMTNHLDLDLHFGNTSLRIGYHGSILTSCANNLTHNAITNSFVIGVSGSWLSLPARGNYSSDITLIKALSL